MRYPVFQTTVLALLCKSNRERSYSLGVEYLRVAVGRAL